MLLEILTMISKTYIKYISAFLLFAGTLWAQNPIIHDQFTADPTARVFNNKVYLFPSHDIPALASQRQDWFCMEDYHVFSSENLTDWTDHGVILSQENVPWGKPDGYSMWAPDCVFKNGKYYFYYPNAPKEGRGFAIGVAIANRPEGPYTPEKESIKGVGDIDPCVLIDDDGTAYLYWSGMGIRGGQLKENMTELRDSSRIMEGLPDGFKEGPFAFKRDGRYYITFPWVRKEKGTETLAYAMSDSPLGPWQFKGIFMAEHDNKCWTNHHSFLEYKGQWYLFYHRNHYSPGMDKRRSACIEKVSFNADGTIPEVKQTLRGVGVTKATERIEVDRYSDISDGVTIDFNDSTRAFNGWHANLPRKGSYIRYDDVDFSDLSDGYLVCKVKANANTSFTIREGTAKGKVLAKQAITVEGETGPFRRDLRGQWLTLTTPIQNSKFKIQNEIVNRTPRLQSRLCSKESKKSSNSKCIDLFVVCEDKEMSIDWVQFKNRTTYMKPASGTSQPDEEGFIRRWLLLEPIKQDIPSNTVFTNTWLREAFGKEYFSGQMTSLPKSGQKEKVGNQKLTWRLLDSETYNVRLFRFAEKWGQQTYGSLFWAVTVIDCPEEIRNVRLAAGSNGASMWWLNSEEVLLLEGDRRMVEDDGMSKRLTLRKGRNILRGAVINGPGLADMCVRFLDEKGKAITNYSINDK